MRQLLCFLLLFLCHQSESQLNCVEFPCETQKILLFTIKGNSGKKAVIAYNDKTNAAKLPRNNVIPELFRSSYIDDLPKAIRETGFGFLVVEMRKQGKVVASATFNVTNNLETLNSTNWFDTDRLIKTFPSYVGNNPSNYADLSIAGHRRTTYQRSFYIHHSHGLCETDNGVMGIGEDAADPCSWVTDGGKPPVLFYSKKKGVYKGVKETVVDYADTFLVFLTDWEIFI